MVCGYSNAKSSVWEHSDLQCQHRCLIMGSGQVGDQTMSLRCFTEIRAKMVEIFVGVGNGEGDSITRDVVDDGFGRVKGPREGASKGEEVLESEGKRVSESGKKGVKERRGWVWDGIEEETFNGWEAEP
ncbi:hypothetical protein E2542_SST27608 [Spatholobus suberectus]|nr:hypothetical protein E2542_SST27608 [Spatholobus suberectus]